MAFVSVDGSGKVKNRRTSKKSKANSDKKSGKGMVYVIKMELDSNEIVYKIGVSNRWSITERLAEVLVGFFNVYRYVPRTEVRRYKRVDSYYQVESYLHRKFKDSKYEFDKVFGGSSEFFMVDEDELLEVYDEVIENVADYVWTGNGGKTKAKVVVDEMIIEEVVEIIDDDIVVCDDEVVVIDDY